MCAEQSCRKEKTLKDDRYFIKLLQYPQITSMGRPPVSKSTAAGQAYHPLPKGGIFQVLDGRFSLAAENLKLSLWSPPFQSSESTTKDASFLKVMTFCRWLLAVSITYSNPGQLL